jgi:hypothetical protein
VPHRKHQSNLPRKTSWKPFFQILGKIINKRREKHAKNLNPEAEEDE